MWQALKGRWQLTIVIISIVLVLLLTYTFRTVLLPFALGLVVAYALLPIFSWFERKLPIQGRFSKLRRVGLILFFIY
jgi:predicted PurR-regulated permease PerM